ncbi:MAG: leucine-rich repeat domain-containing protein [Treponema sp.]|jgi:hypothetical protein|nr:leucine-rich repeat domain-containing protein [Treponema sp.]
MAKVKTPFSVGIILGFLAVLTTIYVLSITGCFGDFRGDEGTITINFGGGSARSNVPKFPPEDVPLTYELTFTGPGDTITLTANTGDTVSLAVAAGLWQIKADAYTTFPQSYYEVRMLYAEAQSSITVIPGYSNPVTFAMEQAYCGCNCDTSCDHVPCPLEDWEADENWIEKKAADYCKDGNHGVGNYFVTCPNNHNTIREYVLPCLGAEELRESEPEGPRFTRIGEAYRISNCTELDAAIVCIPAYYRHPRTVGDSSVGTYPVTQIGGNQSGPPPFQNNKYITSVLIGKNVEIINGNAFSGCINLTNVTFAPDSKLETINGAAFSGCINLTNVTFAPNSKLEKISTSAFSNTGLVSIELPDSVVTIEHIAFSGSGKLEKITIPAGVKEIRNTTFNGCVSLESVEFAVGSQLESIGEAAFWNCESLKSITIPEGVTIIGQSAFGGCTSLTSVTLGSNITAFGDNVFPEGESGSGGNSMQSAYQLGGAGTYIREPNGTEWKRQL